MSFPTASDPPKYSLPECERRWLVTTPPPLTGPGTLLEDRYLDGTRLRLRRAMMPDGAVGRWRLARKYGATAPGVEPMTNLYLTEAEHALLARLPAATIAKRRFDIWIGDHRFVIDRFEGALRGHAIAELEVPDPTSLWAVVPPDWCGREITGEAAFGGASLARAGWPGD